MPKSPIIILLISFVLWGCSKNRELAGIISIPGESWSKNLILSFQVQNDGNSGPENFLYQIAYRPDFEFENIWLKYQLISPKGDTLYSSVDNLFLFEPGSGKPLGHGSSEKLYLDAYFLKNIRLKQPGKYRLLIQHQLRPDAVKGIYSVSVWKEYSKN